MNKSLLAPLALSLLGGCASTVYAQAQAIPSNVPLTQTLPPVKLRGYGTISGNFAQGSSTSQTSITTESVAKAQLLLAKFLSDISLLPGVSLQSIQVPGHKIEVRVIQGQGVVAAVREGAKVRIFTAVDAEKLDGQLRAATLATGAVARAEVPVPMWLDRWDKFGFRFYYRPWDRPKNESSDSYDFINEFDFAQKQDHSGFVFWNHVLFNDNADGMTNQGWWSWAQAEAKKRNLPVALNSTSGNPSWLLNRYREQTQLKMPGFVGNYGRIVSSNRGGQGSLSWNSPEIQDVVLGVVQKALRRYAGDDNVTSFLEPHGELAHGKHDILLEYGPASDANYRRYLQGKYQTPTTVAKRWGKNYTSWEQIHVPELASFLGWGPQALDLSGSWSVGYEELLGKEFTPEDYPERVSQPSKAAPQEWFSTNFDDSAWPRIQVPGHDQQLYTPKRPAVFRRTFDVPVVWKANNQRVWLYVWDMNLANRDSVRYVLNGKPFGTDSIKGTNPHWHGVEVSNALQEGKNTLALRVPQGYIGYRVYLSPVPPRQYPDLGESLNAQWVDFVDFTQWSRLQVARRGMEMLRQLDTNRQITLMAPDAYADGIKQLAQSYGGNFHNTGHMGAFWGDYLPSIMRGESLPFSLEPGSPASDLVEFKQHLGRYQTEGIQGIDYFIHIGSILWNDDLRKHFEANRRQLGMLGKYHYDKAETAVLYSDRIAQLTGYPWKQDSDSLGSGYWSWNAASVLRGHFPYDGLTPSSFASGAANKYRVIVDSNTTIIDEKMVTEIESWVKNGGTFITLAQTGRHTPEKPDSWPIARLAGYKVTKIDQLKSDGNIGESGTLKSAPGQTVLGAVWNGISANGLHLEKTAGDAQDLLLWNDGSVAAGMRPLGKGYIVQLGAKFTGAKIPDRIDPGANNEQTRHLRNLLSSLLHWRKVSGEAGRLSAENEAVLLRPAITNNGLYDVWTLWNQSPTQAHNVTVEFTQGQRPPFVIDARDGKQTPLSTAKLDAIALEPLETRVFLTPRQQLSRAPLEWFDLQRQWWRGTTAPDPKPFPAPDSRFALDLNEGWKYQPVTQNATPLLAAQVQDATWETTGLGVWNTKEKGKHGVLRKTFTVPAQWTNGRISLWLTSWESSSFIGNGRVFLDGREIKKLDPEGVDGLELKELQPGSSHVLAVEVQSAGVLAGLRGHSWLAYEPNPAQKLDLSGQWEASKDALRYDAVSPLPGPYNAQLLRRSILIEDKYQDHDVFVTVESEGPLVGVITNGKLVRRHASMKGDRWRLNVTPFVKFGQQNEIQLVTWRGVGKGNVREVSLGFYGPRTQK